MSTYEPMTKAAHLAQLDYQRVRSAAIRGEVGARQVAGARTALVHGTGGTLSSGGTVILANH